jgi:ribosomal protein S18 acetylase RimI-like enzyme
MTSNGEWPVHPGEIPSEEFLEPLASAVTFTGARAGDFEALVSVRIDAMRESLERIGRFDPVRARERFRDGFSPKFTRHVVVARKRVGFVVVKPRIDGLLLDHLYIKQGAQGSGIGSIVLRQVCMEADAAALTLYVGALKESASNRFYTRHGFQFVEAGEFDNYYVRHAAQGCPPGGG